MRGPCQYRSVVVRGRATRVRDEAEHRRALQLVTDHVAAKLGDGPSADDGGGQPSTGLSRSTTSWRARRADAVS